MDQSPSPKVALVVEDRSIFRMEAVGLMEDAGYVVLEAADAAEAIRELEGCETIAVLLTDVRMPGGMDGFALAREVARRWPVIGIVVMSAERSPNPDELPVGATFVGKPFTPSMILGAVARVMPE